MAKDIRIERWSGTALEQFIPELARLRIEVFRDFPYLYDGDIDYEKKYLQTYIDCPESVIVIAFDGDKVVGASTAIPMKYETGQLKKPFLDQGYLEVSCFTFNAANFSIGQDVYIGMPAAFIELG